jgi:hypothetical protein
MELPGRGARQQGTQRMDILPTHERASGRQLCSHLLQVRLINPLRLLPGRS